MSGSQIEICGYQPGALGRVTQLHGEYYHAHWGFSLFFESQVAEELGAFLSRMNAARDGFWLARVDGLIAGSISIDGSPVEVHMGGGKGSSKSGGNIHGKGSATGCGKGSDECCAKGGGKDCGTDSAEGARLRWFILDPAYHGQGIGARLMDEAMAFCERAGFARVFLCTFAGLDAARALYERHGFELRETRENDQWGRAVTEQLFERLII